MNDQRALRRWRTVALLATGVAIGSMLTATPVYSHVGGSVAHLWTHLKPRTDARYYTKASSNARYYTKAGADARYYTKSASDSRFVSSSAITSLRGELSSSGTINSSGNPVAWTKLSGVPAGFADGTDDAGGIPTDLVCTGCVAATDLADGGVASADIAADAVSGAKLGTVVTRFVTANVADGGSGSGSATCNSGEQILGGGVVSSTTAATEIHVSASRPATDTGAEPSSGSAFTHWFAAATNPAAGEGAATMTIYAVCLS